VCASEISVTKGAKYFVRSRINPKGKTDANPDSIATNVAYSLISQV